MRCDDFTGFVKVRILSTSALVISPTATDFSTSFRGSVGDGDSVAVAYKRSACRVARRDVRLRPWRSHRRRGRQHAERLAAEAEVAARTLPPTFSRGPTRRDLDPARRLAGRKQHAMGQRQRPLCSLRPPKGLRIPRRPSVAGAKRRSFTNQPRLLARQAAGAVGNRRRANRNGGRAVDDAPAPTAAADAPAAVTTPADEDAAPAAAQFWRPAASAPTLTEDEIVAAAVGEALASRRRRSRRRRRPRHAAFTFVVAGFDVEPAALHAQLLEGGAAVLDAYPEDGDASGPSPTPALRGRGPAPSRRRARSSRVDAPDARRRAPRRRRAPPASAATAPAPPVPASRRPLGPRAAAPPRPHAPPPRRRCGTCCATCCRRRRRTPTRCSAR